VDKIIKHKQYEIVHPKTGKVEVWSGERIRVYQMTYRGTVINFPSAEVEIPKAEVQVVPAKKKRASVRSTKTKNK